MTVYSIRDIANIWIASGGSRDPLVLLHTCEIALAESGGDSAAISPSHDYGIWQINTVNFNDGIINYSNWSNPYVNAREAIKLSGNGTNWAAWCTAWLNPAGNCGHGYLPAPQIGSPADMRFTMVRDALQSFVTGTFQIAPGPSAPIGNATVSDAWGRIQRYVAHGGPAQYRTIHSLAGRIGGILR